MNRKIVFLASGGLLLTMTAIVVAFIAAPAAVSLPVYGALPSFQLTDQDNRTATLESLRGQVWIADVIFTRCAGQCLIMSGHMKKIQSALPPGSPIKLVSFTTDPSYDVPAVLQKYAARYGADGSQWFFLTGDKAVLRHAAVDGLKLTVLDKATGEQDNGNDLFIHSAKFVVIDKSGRIRGYFDGETEEGTAQAFAAAKTLARE
ncbi:MAG: SCO family protein [Limisphaerales bacterium]